MFENHRILHRSTDLPDPAEGRSQDLVDVRQLFGATKDYFFI